MPAKPIVDASELRSFGLLTGGIFAGLFGLAMPLLRSRPWPLWPWIICVLMVGTALLKPLALRYVFLAWTAIGNVLGAINTRIIVTIIYVLMIIPMGLIMRAFGKDPMNRTIDRGLSTYRVRSRKPSKSGIERPF